MPCVSQSVLLNRRVLTSMEGRIVRQQHCACDRRVTPRDADNTSVCGNGCARVKSSATLLHQIDPHISQLRHHQPELWVRTATTSKRVSIDPVDVKMSISTPSRTRAATKIRTTCTRAAQFSLDTEEHMSENFEFLTRQNHRLGSIIRACASRSY